ncbi:MAG: L,D-transpeptidase family protein, partial [Rhodospirillales bacterium]|nr:L,D-transpeptidase family protein [Rhodospirillales bacterium]
RRAHVQQSRGLKPVDGILGRKTRVALEALRPPAARDLLVNMEQWRWMPADMGDFHIWVNIPEFTVRVIKNGAVIHTERVVTGTLANQTPIFSETMKTIVLRPDWVLPESIKVREAIPSLLRGSGMFYSSGLKIKKGSKPVEPRSIDWSRADQRHYTFYQPPGDTNALGKVKFLFPNKHAVYLHDTPSKQLFANASRAYSHGCVRVRNPVRLAEILLGHDKGWEAGMVRDLAEGGPEDNRVTLDRPIPVHVTYFTVAPDEAGKLVGHKDIYGHAKRISLALDGRWGEIDVPPDHLAPIEDREFEWRIAAEQQRAAQQRVQSGDPVGRFFQDLFGGGY